MKNNQPVPDYMIVIGKNIKRHRRARELTQTDLAQAMNYSIGHISHIECGTRGMTVDTLLAFCRALDTDCNSLVMEYGKDAEIDEINTLLRNRPEEYIGVVKSFIFSLDALVQPMLSKGEVHPTDAGAKLV